MCATCFVSNLFTMKCVCGLAFLCKFADALPLIGFQLLRKASLMIKNAPTDIYYEDLQDGGY